MGLISLSFMIGLCFLLLVIIDLLFIGCVLITIIVSIIHIEISMVLH